MRRDESHFWQYLDQGFDWSVEPFRGQLSQASSLEQIDPQAAIAEFRLLADRGSAAAMMILGQAYAAGKHLERDDVEAERWYRRAAEIGSPQFQYVLGRFCASQQRYGEAASAYRAASERGVNIAKIAMAVAYAQGRGVEKNHAAARSLLEQAGKAGSPSAKALLGGLLVSDWYHPLRLIRGLWLLLFWGPFFWALIEANGVVAGNERAKMYSAARRQSFLILGALVSLVAIGGCLAWLFSAAFELPVWQAILVVLLLGSVWLTIGLLAARRRIASA